MCFRELLLEAIRDLQNSDKKEQKATLKKLLTSIQNCSKSKNNSPRAPAVKVYHFKHNDSEDEKKEESLEENKTEEIREKVEIEAKNSPPTVDSNALSALEGSKTKDGIKCRERRLNVIFTPIKQRVSHENQTEDVPKGKIRLNITEAGLNSIKKDKKSFDEFRKNNIMYRKAQAVRPWELVEKYVK